MKPRQPTDVGRQGANSGQVLLHDKGTPFETLPYGKGLLVSGLTARPQARDAP